VEVGLEETHRVVALQFSGEEPFCRRRLIGVGIDVVTNEVRAGETVLADGLLSRTKGLSGTVFERDEVAASKENCLGRRSECKMRPLLDPLMLLGLIVPTLGGPLVWFLVLMLSNRSGGSVRSLFVSPNPFECLRSRSSRLQGLFFSSLRRIIAPEMFLVVYDAKKLSRAPDV
jgi:hypothetical protein